MSEASGGSPTPDTMYIDQLIQGLSDEESSNSSHPVPAEENGNDRRDERVAKTNHETATSERFDDENICQQPYESICDSPYQSIGKDSHDGIDLTLRDSVPTLAKPCRKRRKTHNFIVEICEADIEGVRTDTSDGHQDETIRFGVADPIHLVKAEDLKFAVEIGSGNYGRVLKLPFKGPDYCFMAVKCCTISNLGIASMKWDNELKALQKVTSNGRCPYIIHFYGVPLNSEKRPPYFFLEYMDTDLKKAYQELHGRNLSSPENLDLLLRRVAFNVVSALTFMSGHHISHNDVKPANILLDRKGNVKLADFGECDEISDGETTDNTSRGTRCYWPPECVKYPVKCSSQRFNLWALGITLLETTHNQHPHPLNMSDSDFGRYLADWEPPTEQLGKCSNECTDFITKYLLPKNQESQKLIYSDILNSDYLNGISSEPSQEEISLFEMII